MSRVKVLVANRGEIAVRVIRACREMGLASVAVHSDCDRGALHVRQADEAYPLGGNAPADTYLRIDRLVEIARRSGATLVHPGYGFLAENEDFARACADASLTFIGPRAAVIARMGSKTAAREVAIAAGVPVVPGTDTPFGPEATDAAITAEADRIGYPLLVKAVAGGGGKGMRTVSAPADLAAAVRTARSEAASAFGDPDVYLERRLVGPRHIEIQLLGDEHGTVVPFVERECSIQRRHQKVVEESPSLALEAATRRAMAECAARVARGVGYTNAGTIEFLLDRDGRFYFLEMNTRLQVEHPVTEMVTGIDLVQWQIRIALGERLAVDPAQALTPRGHAIECRIYAEDPDLGFMPSPGLVRSLSTPGGPGVRDDRGVTAGFEIPTFYDPMISKLIVWGDTRPAAIARLARVIDEYRVVGVRTTIPFFQWLVRQPEFQAGEFDTTYLDRVLQSRAGAPFVAPTDRDQLDAAVAVALSAWLRAHRSLSSPASDTMGAWRRTARQEGLR
jgi:acetyl-CoA carboxylase biotin carboxylase subunit